MLRVVCQQVIIEDQNLLQFVRVLGQTAPQGASLSVDHKWANLPPVPPSLRWKSAKMGEYIAEEHWRRSVQWFGLTRPLAKVLLADRYVEYVFRRFCFTGKNIACVSDAHCIAVTLAMYGLEEMVSW